MRKEDTVKLISAEGFEFVIHKEAAMVSQTIRNMLTSPGPLLLFFLLFLFYCPPPLSAHIFNGFLFPLSLQLFVSM
jgi:hypothetical protein